MVATAIARSFPGQLLTSPPRQSSLRSITSTHSRRTLQKSHSLQFGSQRRVRFACSDDLDLSGRDEADDIGIIAESIVRFPYIEPLEALYLTAQEILDIRTGARRQAAQFAADHPDYVESVIEMLENGKSEHDTGIQLETLRRRRRRRNTFKVSTKWLDSEPLDSNDGDCYFDDEEDEESVVLEPYCEDDVCDADYYCTMRGLETRSTPLFRLRKKWAIRSVLQIQQEMNQAGCCPAQVEMGLRATAVQATKKSRLFAYHQALLDEDEVYRE